MSPSKPPIYQTSSGLQTIKVYEADGQRILRCDEQYTQSTLALARPETLVLPYMQGMMAGLLFAPPPEKALLLGLGGGDIVRYLHHYLPNAELTAIENDPAMVAIAHDYFALPRDERVHIHIEDARQYLKQASKQLDWILIDLFSEAQLPELLNDAGVYADCHRLLNDDGLLVFNFVANDSEQFKKILWLLRCQFQHNTLCLAVRQHLNILIFAFKQRPKELNKTRLLDKAQALTKDFELDFEGFVENLFTTNPLADGELYF